MVPYDPLRNQQPDAPFLHQLSTLDQQLQTILNDNSIPPELKLQKYTQTLQRYQSLKSQQIPMSQPAKLAQPKIDAEEVLEAVPKPFKHKARLLMQHMKKHDELFDWTPDGQLKYQGKPISGSNVLDLVYDFSRKKGPLSEPAIGSRQFARLLKESNVPKVAIGNSDRMKEPLLSNSRFSALLDDEESDNEEYNTPERKGRLDESWLMDASFGVPKPETPATGKRSSKKKKKEQKKLFDDTLATLDSAPAASSRYPKRERKQVHRFDPVKGYGKRIKKWDLY